MKPWERDDLVAVEPPGLSPETSSRKPWEMDLEAFPEETPREQLARQATHAPRPPRPAPAGPQPPWYQRLPAAVAEPVLRTGLALRKATIPMLPEKWAEAEAPVTASWERDLAALQAAQGEGPLTTAGNIAGEALTLAGPGAAGGAVARTALPKTLGTALGEAGGIAAMEAARSAPGERAQAALYGAGSTLAGHGAGQVLTRALGGLPRSQAGQEMLEAGIPLTPGQAARGSLVPWVEERMAYIPGLAGATGRMQKRAMAEWNRQALQSTIPRIPGAENMQITAAGPEGFSQAQRYLGTLYDEVLGGADQSMTPKDWKWFANALNDLTRSRAVGELDDQTAGRLTRFLSGRAERMVRAPSAQSLQRYHKDARDLASSFRAKGDFQAADIVDMTLEGLDSVIPPQIAKAYRQLNTSYARYKTLEKAGSYKSALENDGVFSPDNLLSAVKARGSGPQLTRQTAPWQPEAGVARETIGAPMARGGTAEKYVSPGAVGAAALMEPVTTAGALAAGRTTITEPMRRFLTGQYSPEEEMAASLRRWLGRGAAGIVANEDLLP